MNLIGKLKIIPAPARNSSPISIRRSKLIKALTEQKDMVTAKLAGSDYARTKQAWDTDAHGNRVRVRRDARLRQWWSGEDSAVFFALRYGSKPLELRKGMSAIDVGAIQNLPAVIDTLIQATGAGELDDALGTASERRIKVKPRRAA